MKKLITYLLVLMFFTNFSFGQVISFPDLNLKTILSLSNTTTYKFAKNFSDQWMQIDTNGDGEIQITEAVLVKAIYFRNQNMSTGGSLTIHNITGLESFSNLEYLNTSYNNFNSFVNFSSLITLKELQLFNCGISSLNVSGLNMLEIFGCNGNNITSLNLSSLTSLNVLYCGVNQIQELNLNNNLQLSILGCSYNQISTLDCSNNPLLTKLACSNNNLTSINIKNGINHNFITPAINDCWKTGNPNLTTICVDASETASVQNFLDGCNTNITTPIITSNCGLSNEQFVKNEVKIFPNPVNIVLNIDLTNESINYKKVVIVNVLGKEVLKTKITPFQTNEIDVSSLENGLYILQISNDLISKNIKIIKN